VGVSHTTVVNASTRGGGPPRTVRQVEGVRCWTHTPTSRRSVAFAPSQILYPHPVDAAAVGAGFTVSRRGSDPDYDQLCGEQINADVPPSPADHHVHSGRHRLDEQTPSAAAVVGRPSSPGTGGLTGHHQRVWTYPGAGLAGDERAAGRAWGSRAAIAAEAPARAAPQHPGHPSAGAGGDLPAVPAATAGGNALGHQAVGAARPERTERRPTAVREAVFSWFCRKDPVTGSLADTAAVCCGQDFPLGVGPETPATTAVEDPRRSDAVDPGRGS
jgi:hypothetical protein